MGWHTRDIVVEYCKIYVCSKKATVRLYDNFNADYGPYCKTCGKARAASENKVLDKYNKFHRDKEKK